MISNRARIGRALYLLKIDLDNFVPREFLGYHREQATAAVNQILGQTRNEDRPFERMKTQDLLTVMQSSWWTVFDRALGGVEPGTVREVALAHEAWASRQDFSPEGAFQVLNAIQRILAAMESPCTLEMEILKRECLESGVEADEGQVQVQEQGPTPPHSVAVEGAIDVEPEAAPAPAEPVQPESPTPAAPVAAEHRGETAETVGQAVAEAGPAPEPAPDGSQSYPSNLIRALRAAGALQDQDHLVRATTEPVLPAEAGDTAIGELEPALAQALEDLGIDRLWDYQNEAIALSLSGANVALEVGGFTDETLAWAIPMADTLLRNPSANALVLCPDEPSANAVLALLSGLLAPVGLPVVTTLDGLATDPPQPGEAAAMEGKELQGEDSPKDELPDEAARGVEAQEEEPIPSVALVTTPEGLDSLVPSSGYVERTFMANLKFVALEGVREYQGNFGSNVALLLRRLFHRLAILGADPCCFVAIPGISNGAELAASLTGKQFEPVRAVNTPASLRHNLFIEPREPSAEGASGLTQRVARAALACVGAGRSVLVQCASENQAREAFAAAQALAGEAAEGLLSLPTAPPEPSLARSPGAPADAVAAGAGSVDGTGVGATGAVFIASPLPHPGCYRNFDGIIVAGYPGSLSRLRQLMDSAGTGPERESFFIYYASEDFAGRFAAHNLDALLAMPPTQAVADADLPEAVALHLPAVLRELEGRVYSFTRDTLGSALFQALCRDAPLLKIAGGAPSPLAAAREAGLPDWALIVEDAQVGQLSPYGKFREIYPGSVALAGGARYRVASVNDAGPGSPEPQVILEESETLAHIRTAPTFAVNVSVQDESLCLSPATGVSLYLGAVAVEETLEKVSVIDESDATGGGDAPEDGGADLVTATFEPEEEIVWRLQAPSFWLDVAGLLPQPASSGEAPDQGGPLDPVAAGSVAAVAQMLRVGAAFTFCVGRYDLATYSQGSAIYLVEVGPQAQGVAKRAFDLWRELLEKGAFLARACPCRQGCIRCLLPHTPWEEGMDKEAGLALAEKLLETA